MQREKTGDYEVWTSGGAEIRAFVPVPLPPSPALALEGRLRQSLETATLALGRLDGIASVPRTHFRPNCYCERSAAISSP